MRTRWMLAASILVLMTALIPGALRAAEEPGCAPAPAVTATANEPAPAATDLPIWAAPPTLYSSPQTPRVIDGKPLFLASCSSCPPLPRCRNLHSCVLMGCC
ncbi:MAG TPA: hypothetical protein VGR07_06775 [Thermoanaerobaculia bacterium]|jgi:hypothetical protein|nr:hypothetical protein [Thermoanaerobaculia bacterium]